ncbi:hybrid sensor histidine kinase/response regulator [Pseudoxanthomonas japonensis]|uniref:hybrid sensor histidine kinase/response regulator n=1 Tax=Pseudoxanthomonas japonensis TaxID=69284 RepID=UPI001BCC3712|nr:hybrid sensor histidine kinase/response regulator [Pseudoxanthomonas japonensis]MCR6624826.1 ATP-binding protein [Pseudoxanthomonas sp.]NCT72193.1 response regulator [Xanthomonadaceae bacterium]
MACATASVVSLGLHWSGLAGPWLPVATAAGGAALLAAFVAAWHARADAHRHAGIQARAAMAESERDGLQRDLQRHDRLEQELVRAKQAAESAAMAKGEFLATMSHEIRTPLNGIVPMLEMLSRAPLAADQREMLTTATASSHQLLRIVDDILDYSKLEANKLDLEITGFNLRELLDGVLQLMYRPAENKGLRLSLQLDPAVRLPVRGDPVRLRQVLTNLVGNAIKFTERGSVTLVVRRLGETAAQHLLRFEVRDTGIGIEEDARHRLFHSFSQADASTTRLYGGTGLGLAICRRIVDLMGGRIDVVSEVGRGSTFWFEVPLMKVIGDLRQRDNGALDHGRVLIVSPDARLRQRLTLLATNWGMHPVAVETTQEALDRLRLVGEQGQQDYLAVLADIGGIRSTALALHRAITRRPTPDPLRLLWLYGDDTVPAELHPRSTLLSRQSPDADLRAALTGATPEQEADAVDALDEIFPESAVVLPPADDAMPAPGEALADAPLPPVVQAEDTATTEPEPAVVSAMRTEPRLLLVEDNPVNLLVAQKLLSVLGFRCETAANGDIALKRMQLEHFDLILMDCQMPVLDGYAATRRWRELETQRAEGGRLPIVAMTANAMAGDRQRCLDAGMDDYLAKPVSREQLESCLHRWLPDRMNFVLRNAALVTPAEPAPPSPAVATARAPAPSFPVLDQTMLEELREIAGDETSRIISIFLEDAPRLIGTLEKAAAVPDLDAMRDAAHTLKSSSANVGAMALSAAAKRVELGARARKLERPAVAVALVIAEYARARMALQGYAAQQLGRPLLPPQQAATAQSSSLVNR